MKLGGGGGGGGGGGTAAAARADIGRGPSIPAATPLTFAMFQEPARSTWLRCLAGG